MRGIPTVLMTCDRCGSTERIQPMQKLPTGWRWIRTYFAGTDDQDVIDGKAEFCQSCVQKFNDWLTIDREG